MDYRVKMVLEHKDMVKEHVLPDGYTLRFYKEGEEDLWAYVETLADEFESEEKALERFKREFGGHEKELESRLMFLENNEGEVVGTIMGWYGDLRHKNEGRIHWVGIIPEYQGKGLAKPLLYSAMALLMDKHDHVYLTTQYSSIEAINLYEKFGFVGYIDDETHPDAWPTIRRDIDALNEKRRNR